MLGCVAQKTPAAYDLKILLGGEGEETRSHEPFFRCSQPYERHQNGPKSHDFQTETFYF